MHGLLDVLGIGKVTIKNLSKLGIDDIHSLLMSFPKRYEINKLDDFEMLSINRMVSIKVRIDSDPKVYYIRKKLTKLTFVATIRNLKINVSIFNREYLSKSLSIGIDVVITGKFIDGYHRFSATNIVLFSNFKQGIVPIYNLEGIQEKRIHNAVKEIICKGYIPEERLPDFIMAENRVIPIQDVFRKIHLPNSVDDIEIAKKRLIYEEFLNLALRIEAIKRMSERILTPVKRYDIEIVKVFINSLDFELTDDQKRVTNEVFMDFKRKNQMNRLVQGDVGSGKTVISIISALAVVTANYQVAVLAPTLVLANQHYNTFVKYLKDFGFRIELLNSEVSNLKRNQILTDLKDNKINIIIGTQSLLQPDVEFGALGFVVIDEQQRFGVNQRKTMRQKGLYPDVLMMTATPIPRTLAIALFESTEVSQIREKPKNRKSIRTKIVEYENMNDIFQVLDSEIQNIHEAYVIAPLIVSYEDDRFLSVEDLLTLFAKRYQDLAILHGKMSDFDKNRILSDFYNNKTKILISTTVVEVGVNVENATVMIVMNANAFGLAQLHQLRGRVGRNSFDSYCFLVIDDDSTERERINILETTEDGFLISEYDLEHRGFGEVFGNVQSGLPDFRFASIIKDKDIQEYAFSSAKRIFRSNDSKSKMMVLQSLKSIQSYNLD